MVYVPNRKASVAVVAAATLAALACSGCGSSTPSGLRMGTALGGGAGDGVTSGVTSPTPRIYYISFPTLSNVGNRDVAIEGFRFAHVPRTVHVLGYVVHSMSQFGGRYLFDWDPAYPTPTIPFAQANPLPTPYVIKAGAKSRRFAMAKVRLLKFPPVSKVSGCEVIYRYPPSPERYLQELPCEYYFGDPYKTAPNHGS